MLFLRCCSAREETSKQDFTFAQWEIQRVVAKLQFGLLGREPEALRACGVVKVLIVRKRAGKQQHGAGTDAWPRYPPTR